jgi:predicted Zn-dependent protease
LEKIAIIKSDPVLRRHWLEARMSITPDDPELLRAHAHLLASLGDEEAERDVRRLEALGLDTAADRSLLSGLRARAGARSEALEAIENALAEDPSIANDWYSHAKLLHQDEEMSKALTSVDRCLELDRQHGEAWALMAILLAPKQNKLKEALKAATYAVALECGGVELMLLKVDLLIASGSPSDAEVSNMQRRNPNPLFYHFQYLFQGSNKKQKSSGSLIVVNQQFNKLLPPNFLTTSVPSCHIILPPKHPRR